LQIILTHENADFDGIASLLGASKLWPDAVAILPTRLNRNVAGFIMLYRSALPFAERDALSEKDVRSVILVDTQRMPSFRKLSDVTFTILDHHALSDLRPRTVDEQIEPVGATVTLLSEKLQSAGVNLTSLEATLLALGLYEDTGSLSFASTTTRDARALAWLLEQGADLNAVRQFLEAPLSEAQKSLFDLLSSSAERREVHGADIVVCTATVGAVVSEIRVVVHKLMESLGPSALFALVESPKMINLIARSSRDAVDVAAVLRELGGGGHPSAASATLTDVTLPDAAARVWKAVESAASGTDSALRVRDLMSLGAHTFAHDALISDIILEIRRLGHEGYPVIRDGRVVGVLNRREADRASSHDLRTLRVEDVMASGEQWLKPEDSVHVLEQTMVSTGLGQLPVVDDDNRLIGIVTRTDLICHWAREHQHDESMTRFLADAKLSATVGEPAFAWLKSLAAFADRAEVQTFVAGGVVRDALLGRPNQDIDIVIQGDAITFARTVQAEWGGSLTVHVAFGTAVWTVPRGAEARTTVTRDLPEHIDFVSARDEYYAHPTALPTVRRGSFRLDLRRRDFTINALAVRLSPVPGFGELIDEADGLRDLQARRLRVLHSLSFVDDPTRILRAIRFQVRLDFDLDPQTDTWLTAAIPLLGQVSGERIFHELTLVLEESAPESILSLLDSRHILEAIDADLGFNARSEAAFRRAREASPGQPLIVYLCIWLAPLGNRAIETAADRFRLSTSMRRVLLDTAKALASIASLSSENLMPSQIVRQIEAVPAASWDAIRALVPDPILEERLDRYEREWRNVRPILNGDGLRAMDVPVGPLYRALLGRLRDALLDGAVPPGLESEKMFVRQILNDRRDLNRD